MEDGGLVTPVLAAADRNDLYSLSQLGGFGLPRPQQAAQA